MYPYSKKELYSMRPHKGYHKDAREASFLLGGIGTGNISIGARGELRDMEIFNRPGKGNWLPYSFFAIWAKPDNRFPITKVLESDICPPYTKSHGFSSEEFAGLPRMDFSSMKAEYPFVWIDFKDKELPLKIRLEAFSPFIPLNSNDSGIPGIIFRYSVKNISKMNMEITIMGSMANVIGFEGYDEFEKFIVPKYKVINEYKVEENLKGLFYYSDDIPMNHLKFGNIALITSDENVTVKENWHQSGWWDSFQDFWEDFSKDGKLKVGSNIGPIGSKMRIPVLKVGSLGIYSILEPKEEKVFEIILTWYFPNRVKNWDEDYYKKYKKYKIIKNYYSTLFIDAWDVGKYLTKNKERLEKGSRDFHRALFNSTFPEYVIHSIANNITVIRSTTCFRIENGLFLAYEGSSDTKGCGPGNCTHVWNYAQTLAFLFPDLEQSMRLVDFGLETDNKGRMNFRSLKVLDMKNWDNIDSNFNNLTEATDGQLGTIIRLYREWKFSGKSELIERLWSKVKGAINYALKHWDSDRDFVLNGQQHVTYDIEFYGINSLTNTLFFTALKAGIEMAEYMSDNNAVKKYKKALEIGTKKMDRMLWNGEYYVQKLNDINKFKYQYGEGCFSDQLFGQLIAHITGLGYILPKDHVKKALASIFKHNFKTSFKKHVNLQRTYILNDEKGLINCSWSKGKRPKFPFVYSDEVWTGIEYQVAAHLIYEGFIDEGLTIVKAIRERQDGYKRNPWNEVEWGNHYVRSMASWSLLLALSGFRYDLRKKSISFNPVINKGDFRTFWSTGNAWGIYKQKIDKETKKLNCKIDVLYGDIEDIKVNIE